MIKVNGRYLHGADEMHFKMRMHNDMYARQQYERHSLYNPHTCDNLDTILGKPDLKPITPDPIVPSYLLDKQQSRF